jgi:hypothetical protein
VTVYLSPPDNNRSYAVAADWLELLALSKASGIASSEDLSEAADILFDPAAEDDLASNDYNPDIVNHETETAMDAIFDEVGFRADCLGEKYPFRASFSERRLRLERKALDTDQTLVAAHNIYVTCLLMSCVRFNLLDIKSAGVSENDIGDHFQILATAAAAGYVGGDAYLFGHPRPDQTSMLDAVGKLTNLINAGVPSQTRPAGTSVAAKDGGIDVVAWRDHIDRRPSKAVLFGQCASGKNWPGKSVLGYANDFRQYFERFLSHHWLPALFVPFQIYAEKERAHALKTELDRSAFYLAQEGSMGVIIDRLRLVHWASAIWDQLPAAANEALSDVTAIWNWRDQALGAARAA